MELKIMFIIDVLLYIIGIFFCVSLISVMVFMVVALKRFIKRRD
nr:MAG TPA: SPACA1 acrosome membrane-associated protein 1 [Caudoviricetes sp.]